MALIVDPLRFQADGAIIDWLVAARRLGLLDKANIPPELRMTVQLRWMLRPDMGMPTEPFIVWRRKPVAEKDIAFKSAPLLFLPGYKRITWTSGILSHVTLDVQAPSGGIVLAYAGAPTFANVVDYATLAAGNASVRLAAPVIDGLLLSSTINVNVNGLRGLESGALALTKGWEQVELVGLPVKESVWSGIGKHGTKQGLVSAMTDAQDAAIQRLKRGAPPFGWGPLLASGVPAPLWAPPNSAALVAEANTELLDSLRGVMSGFPPNLQIAQKLGLFLPPPENSSGNKMSGSGSTSFISPLGMTLLNAGSETFSSLVLGFGTAYPFVKDAPFLAAQIPNRGFDWMITARWEKGLDGNSAAVEFAALVPTPREPIPPPPPANIGAELMGYLRPFAADGDWRSSIRVRWDKPPKLNLFRSRSFAFARAGLAPAEASRALMTKRPSGGHAPILINEHQTVPPDPEFWRIHAVDREMSIPANPGARIVKHAAAAQDLYGQWSPWVDTDSGVAQPDLDKVRIVHAELKPALPATAAGCPATLTIEFLWDWRVRRPKKVQFVGSLYAAANSGDGPPAATVPAGLQLSLGGGAGSALEIIFAGDIASAAGATIIALNEAGDKQVSFGPAQGNDTRRYRVAVPGFTLNFAASGQIGLGLFARAQERILPQRTGPWGDEPSVIMTSDPRPPVVVIEHVDLASLPDSAGESHARIAWAPQAGVAGYFVYESTETKILLANSLSEPTPDRTLDQRLATLKNAFRNNPSRREFTRRNATLLSGTSLDVTLPRGSTAIHTFVVLGVSAGQVEGNWPSGPNADDALIAVVAPRILPPAAPTIELQRILDSLVDPPVFRARMTIATRPGARVSKVDLHRVRVDDAAKELDTMGPPIATLAMSGGGWTITSGTDAAGTSFIEKISGFDSPPGSWKRVWYRAVAWSEKDATRGCLPGRSPASSAAWVVIPPAAAPAISAITMQWPGGDPDDVLLKWTSPAPVKKTALGPHTVSVSARTVGAAEGSPPLIALESPLHQLGTTAPAMGSGVWRASAPGVALVEYRALVKRASINDLVKFSVRITDPLGRAGERILQIAAGPIDPPPDLSDITVKAVAPPLTGIAATFKSSALMASPGGSFRVRVTVTRRRRPGPFPPIAPRLMIDLPVEDVPVGAGFPSGAEPLTLRRAAGAGPQFSYAALCRVPISKFTVRITAPDGRFVEKEQAVS